MLSIAEELFFWSGIMRDHAEFFLLGLSSRETEFITNAQYFKDAFITIHNKSKELVKSENPSASPNLLSSSLLTLQNFIYYKRLALKKLLTCSIQLNYPPSFINHMINEAFEFNKILTLLKVNLSSNPIQSNIHILKIWLPDASGHAASIASGLDPTEKGLIEEAELFEKKFNDLFIRASELGKMLQRTNLDDGSLAKLNADTEKEIIQFIKYLSRIEGLRENCKAMGFIMPLVPNHMIREEEYFLVKLKQFNKFETV